MDIQEIDALIASNPQNSELYYRRGKEYWRRSQKGEAISDFNRAVALDPESPAKIYLKMATDVMDFYNTDLYNP